MDGLWERVPETGAAQPKAQDPIKDRRVRGVERKHGGGRSESLGLGVGVKEIRKTISNYIQE